MQNFIDPFRKTGRTTRMLEEAARLQSLGKRVCIVVANFFEVNRIIAWLSSNDRENLAKNGLYEIHVISPLNSEWSWLDWRDYSFHPETIYLVDNHAIQANKTFRRMLSELHRFDINQTPGGHLFIEGACRQCGHRTTDDPESCDSVQSKKGLDT